MAAERAAQPSNPERPGERASATTWRSYVAEAPAWAIVVGAMAVSFWTQVAAVVAHAFARWEALIWSFSTDFGTVACLFLAREAAHRGTPSWGAWALSVACALMSVQFNVVSDLQRGDWLGVEAHVWMPALALGVWYWLLHGRHRKWERPSWLSYSERERRSISTSPQAAGESADQPSAGGPRATSRGNGRRSSSLPHSLAERVPAVLAEIAAERECSLAAVKAGDVAERLGLHRDHSTVSRLRRDFLAARQAERAA